MGESEIKGGIHILLPLVLMLCCVQVSGEGELGHLQGAWQDQLQLLPEADLSGAELGVQKALISARNALRLQLLKSPPDPVVLAGAYGALGNLYQLYAVPALAEICYQNARLLEPENYRWSYYVAYLDLVSGRTEQALKGLEMVAKLKPDYPPLRLRQGQAWFELNELSKSRRILNDAAKFTGTRASALYYLGQIDLLEKKYQHAAEILEEALRIAPQANRIHYPLAAAYRGMGDEPRAREQFSLYGTNDPQVDDPLIQELQALEKGGRPLFGQAMEAVGNRDYANAARLFRAGLERDSDNINARISLARALYLSGERELSRTTLEAVLGSEPDNILALFLLGILEDAAGEPTAAARLQKVLELDQQHAGANYFLANQRLRAGRFREAVIHYDAVLSDVQDNPLARVYRLVALYHAGASDFATQTRLREIIVNSPNNYLAVYAAVRLLALSSDPQVLDPGRAKSLAEELVRAMPVPPHLEALALASAANGDFEHAIGILKQLLANAYWMGTGPLPVDYQNYLRLFEKRQMPKPPWPLSDPLLVPQQTDVAAVFTEYPSPVPF
ncbi:MAG: tetratricopeptide repeat protein [Gammaproteobacteria bacterium]|nr:tetratricopeptide repeat protein [Gammaproteobacteria bacterium]